MIPEKPKNKKLLFSVTAKDCDWDYIRGSGKGGQKRNKTSNAVRCTHKNSRAVGYSDEERSQRQNRESSFVKMANTKQFRSWIAFEVSRITGVEKEIEQRVELEMRKIKVEIRQNGKWVEVDKDATLPDNHVC